MRRSPPRLAYALGPFTLAAFIPAGCDPGDDASVGFRAEDAPFWISDLVLDPVPGSGGCEGCVTGFARSGSGTSATMIVRSDVKFVGPSLYASDDLTLTKQGLNLSWQLEGKSASTSLCSGKSCAAINLGPTPVGDTLLMLLQLKPTAPEPTRMRFIEIGGQSWLEGPHVVLSGDAATAEPGTLTSPPLIFHDPVTPALAHITYPAQTGGFRSCSGSLVGDRLVLTAAHCLIPEGQSGLLLGAWPLTRPPPPDLEVRLGGLHSPDHPAFPDGSVHTAAAVHIYSDPNLDLALIVLNASTCRAPLALTAPPAAAKKAATPELIAYGYGVSGIPLGAADDAYDWGRLKRTTLHEESDFRPGFANAAELLTFEHSANSIGVCRGDSGGPVIRKIGTSHQLVGVMLARVVEVSTEEGTEPFVELTSGNGFAFTRYNACGMVSPRGYVAARLDNVAVQDWIDDIAVLQPAPLCVPVQPPAATL